MRKLLLVTMVGALLMSAGVCWSGIPHLIHYQGMLTDDEGTPLNTPQDITFRIYNDLTDGTLKWSETQYGIMVTDGLFNVNLGDSTPIDLAFDEDYWLEIDVGPGEILTPRVQLTSVGYAYRAEQADTAAYAQKSAAADNDWIFRITDTADTTLMTGGQWGIARSGNVLYGDADSTHVNLGYSCTTGTSGENQYYCTVGGGIENTASRGNSTVGGGVRNTASSGNATVGGGIHNTASSASATVGGGSQNTASSASATVGGGEQNDATGDHTTVGGGYGNSASGSASTVGGGWNNTASGLGATVGGGAGNEAINYRATVAGGDNNEASGDRSAVGGGDHNTASGSYSTVPGGWQNLAAGVQSFAAGYRAKADHNGTFVWGDYTEIDFHSTGENQFLIRASGGVGIGTNNPGYTLDVAGDVNVSGSVKKGGTDYTHPDYVFEPDYELMSLDKLKKYVNQNKCLPNVISAEDVKRNNGFNMDELLIQMLEKIEEQTLYIFQLEERIAELERGK